MKKIILVILLLAIAACTSTTTPVENRTESNTTEERTMCTADVLECSDGSFVSRSGPDCRFAECPFHNELLDKKQNSTNHTENKTLAPAATTEAQMANTMITMETTKGTMKIKLYDDKAPKTVENFKTLVAKGYYNGIIFHRVIKGFMIQGGDPTGTGMGGPGYTIKDEFGPGLKHSKKGMLSMANAGPNTGGSQFFITLAATPWLDGKHAIFGEVVEGLDVLETIGSTPTDPSDKPRTEVKMVKVTVSS